MATQTADAITAANEAITELNNAILNRTGGCAAAPHPGHIPPVEELIQDPPVPDFSILDDEDEIINMVSKLLSLLLCPSADFLQAGRSPRV